MDRQHAKRIQEIANGIATQQGTLADSCAAFFCNAVDTWRGRMEYLTRCKESGADDATLSVYFRLLECDIAHSCAAFHLDANGVFSQKMQEYTCISSGERKRIIREGRGKATKAHESALRYYRTFAKITDLDCVNTGMSYVDLIELIPEGVKSGKKKEESGIVLSGIAALVYDAQVNGELTSEMEEAIRAIVRGLAEPVDYVTRLENMAQAAGM